MWSCDILLTAVQVTHKGFSNIKKEIYRYVSEARVQDFDEINKIYRKICKIFYEFNKKAIRRRSVQNEHLSHVMCKRI